MKCERLSAKQLKGNNTAYREQNNYRTYYLCEVFYAENVQLQKCFQNVAKSVEQQI